jgi:hypothetical protein
MPFPGLPDEFWHARPLARRKFQALLGIGLALLDPGGSPGGLPSAVFSAQSAGEKIQLKGKIRLILALDAFPRQPQCGLAQESTSPPNSSIASCSESEPLEHFRCRLISWPPLGHSKTNR